MLRNTRWRVGFFFFRPIRRRGGGPAGKPSGFGEAGASPKSATEKGAPGGRAVKTEGRFCWRVGEPVKQSARGMRGVDPVALRRENGQSRGKKRFLRVGGGKGGGAPATRGLGKARCAFFFPRETGGFCFFFFPGGPTVGGYGRCAAAGGNRGGGKRGGGGGPVPAPGGATPPPQTAFFFFFRPRLAQGDLRRGRSRVWDGP